MKIAYKIIMPILTLAIFPVLIFLPILHLNITSSLAGSLSANLGIPEYTSAFQIIKMVTGMEDTQSTLWQSIGKALMDKDGTLGSMFTSTGWLYAFAVFAALMLLLALAAAVLSIVTRRYGLTTCITAGSLVSAFAMNKCFDAFAKPFLNGQISLSSLLSSGGDTSGILGSLLGSLAKVESLELAAAYSFAFFLLLCAVIFSAIVFIMKRNEK